jgi:hypothetical protein
MNPVKTEFHQIPSIDSFIKFNGIPWKIQWNFPWNSMEKYHEKSPSNVYEKFHGIPWKIS